MTRFFATALSTLVFAAIVQAAPINVQIFRSATDTGSNITFSNPACSFGANVINTGFTFHPCSPALSAFGADFTGLLSIRTTGPQVFSLTSDDGSYLFVDGSLVINDGGNHAQNTVNGSVNLIAGTHTLEVKFRENGTGSSGVDLTIPRDATFVPEPSTLSFILTGFVFVSIGLRYSSKRNSNKANF